jgi:phage gpG-like protein
LVKAELMRGRVGVDLRDVVDGYDAMIKRGRSFLPVWQELKPAMKKDLASHRGGPDGSWPMLAPSTIEARRAIRSRTYTRGKNKGKVRKRISGSLQLGKLRTAWSITPQDKGVIAESKIQWSSVHDEGGAAGRRSQIPQRTFAWVSDDFITKAATLARDYIQAAF